MLQTRKQKPLNYPRKMGTQLQIETYGNFDMLFYLKNRRYKENVAKNFFAGFFGLFFVCSIFG
jgi:hypothetical protein